MIAGITPNGLLAAAFGTRAVRGSSMARPTTDVDPTQREDELGGKGYAQPVDSVDILSVLSGESKEPSFSGDASQAHARDGTNPTASTKEAGSAEQGSPDQRLSSEEKEQVADLKRRDQEVRRHEQAHAASAGSYARGGPSFEYQTGPDGKRYAVSGEVNIDTSPISGNPKATIAKMEQVRRAALAPSEPSSQDRAVAAQAAAAAQQARAELAQESQQGSAGDKTAEKATGPLAAYESAAKSDLAATGSRIDVRI